MTTVTLQERLEEATEDLSRCQVAADVAEILRVEGVQGKRGDCEACPIAVLLLKRLGPGVHVEVGERYMWARLGEPWQSFAHVPTSKAVRTFIGEFDYEAYDSETETTSTGLWDEFAVASP